MAGTSVASPGGNKVNEVRDWLLLIGRDEKERALSILGKVVEEFLEVYREGEGLQEDRQSLRDTFAKYGLRYVEGGTVVSGSTGGATKSLSELLKSKNYPAVLEEFERATQSVDTEPREAASAAANILEGICKEYILHKNLAMPAKQDLSRVFDVARKDLGFDPSALEDDDLKTILSGLIATVSGIAALRTHGSSAHAQATSRRSYKLAPRHARLAVHSAHAIVAFILETWAERESGKK